ncbi:hypothetical protein SAMN05192563_1009125 [Paraburkholderia aspalathi]|jgi:hypothetical protein|uniref:Uncharacterized protein n=1 Tax=Paraburkholderia aspalathi TaxID=1324617 RepID=A0A1I7DBP7_9BURK|nr:hypothetical protein SAMN05192563_1009125 [Paraburkholderia aspalathi]
MNRAISYTQKEDMGDADRRTVSPLQKRGKRDAS